MKIKKSAFSEMKMPEMRKIQVNRQTTQALVLSLENEELRNKL